MTEPELQAYQAFVRVVQCIRRHPELEEKARRSTCFATLESSITTFQELEQAQAVENATATDLTAVAKDQAADMRLDLRALAGIADLAGVQNKRGPKVFLTCTHHDSALKHVAQARAMAQLGRDYAERLGDTYEPKIPSSLDEAANRLEATIRARDEALARRKGAHAAAVPLVRKGIQCIDILDSLFRQVLTPGIAAEWDQAKTFERSHVAKRRAVAVEPDPAPEQTAPPAALPAPPKALPAPSVLELPAAPILGRIAMLFGGSRKRRDDAEQRVEADFTVDETRRLSQGEKPPEA